MAYLLIMDFDGDFLEKEIAWLHVVNHLFHGLIKKKKAFMLQIMKRNF
jgi:hypothetical protein